MLLDDLLPAYEINEIHRVRIAAPPDRVFAALKEVTPGEMPLVRLLFGIRSLPARLVGQRGLPTAATIPLYGQMLAAGFVDLGEEADREMVAGTIEQLWKLRGGAAPPALAIRNAHDFVAFDAPGYAKAAMNFLLWPMDGETELVTETRVLTTDAGARRRFGRYWRVIRPGSAAIRRGWLRAVKRRAERGAVEQYASGRRLHDDGRGAVARRQEGTMPYLRRFVRSNGGLLTFIGIAHIALGLTEVGILSDIAGDGVINAIEPHEDRKVWFWYMTAGWAFFLIGRLTIAIERRNERLPVFLAWSTFGIAAFGVVAMPVSGFWTILAVSGLMLRNAYRRPAAGRTVVIPSKGEGAGSHGRRLSAEADASTDAGTPRLRSSA